MKDFDAHGTPDRLSTGLWLYWFFIDEKEEPALTMRCKNRLPSMQIREIGLELIDQSIVPEIFYPEKFPGYWTAWDTPLAFDLWPCIEIYTEFLETNRFKWKWRQVKLWEPNCQNTTG